MDNSPWNIDVKLKSPDGKHLAKIENAMEIAMGAPTSGLLKITTGFELDHCNPSMVWSDNSKYLAVPQWTKNHQQRLVLISVENSKVAYSPKKYKVLQLHNFSNGIVKGIDSPIHEPKPFEIDTNKLNWRSGI
jgi:hypothetical protein